MPRDPWWMRLGNFILSACAATMTVVCWTIAIGVAMEGGWLILFAFVPVAMGMITAYLAKLMFEEAMRGW